MNPSDQKATSAASTAAELAETQKLDAEVNAEMSKDFQFANPPNLLTLFRIAMIPWIVFCLAKRDPEFWSWVAGWSFALAAITDYFDGYLARTRNYITVYGKLMDPLADKFLVVASLAMLQDLGRVHPYIVIVLICRELGITSLRALASAEGVNMPTSKGGKWKTTIQMIGLPWMMVDKVFFEVRGYPIGLFQIGSTLVYLSLALSLWSAKDYVVDFFRLAKEKRRLKKLARQKK
jgi:CDP-diacylglycerol--glycerol-3-phosphate 3-phosphatidyltransferase